MVKEAIAHKQTLLAYQPVMRASNHDKVAFYEGLIRVLDATGRVIPAGEFMPVIEATELGREIDVLALRMGLQALSANPGLRLSINMSARSIGYGGWTKMLNRHLRQDKTLGERLILEITESSAMLVPELVVDFMDDLQPKGVCFALDDFGAGFTAIRYFSDFYFDIVKIDGQFINGIAQNPENRVITTALLSIAEHFDMLTVAEFVENAEDAALLTELGFDCLQGYQFGAPTTRPAWLQSRNKRAG
ncbi:EAL domain-containing protein [Sulfitobacter sp. M57]|nr:EAL domain-containing protein [Sulfitobacter sp. KE5]MDF3423056.1 EAL domain-containing protein [Sulfitobacter sp. KE43]MDF3434121.1 EAL domain-containing protein [Sulfitobacter sp. KE42]MDF3459846.1 EAL domain-containing protein [Sulfitobacter sp. S74]MDF3463660.1 EAL domain-containing protein [Sulfitobacter sp. Ks18]MDF3467612.1 EAL domain-containing protein [Sulfitobacter sp. M05]MDF3471455.1 EAL domain-containing protein [Sulfitobacter sp. M28]MDF3475204.1 EAL domain-containing protei